MCVLALKTAGGVQYFVANWVAKMNGGQLHVGPFSTEKEAWEWIAAVVPA